MRGGLRCERKAQGTEHRAQGAGCEATGDRRQAAGDREERRNWDFGILVEIASH